MKEFEFYRETLLILKERFHKDTITAIELAEYLDMNATIVRRYIKNKNLPGKKVDGVFKIPLTQLAKWECSQN